VSAAVVSLQREGKKKKKGRRQRGVSRGKGEAEESGGGEQEPRCCHKVGAALYRRVKAKRDAPLLLSGTLLPRFLDTSSGLGIPPYPRRPPYPLIVTGSSVGGMQPSMRRHYHAARPPARSAKIPPPLLVVHSPSHFTSLTHSLTLSHPGLFR